jgi:hypothetical protein
MCRSLQGRAGLKQRTQKMELLRCETPLLTSCCCHEPNSAPRPRHQSTLPMGALGPRQLPDVGGRDRGSGVGSSGLGFRKSLEGKTTDAKEK